MTTLKIDLNKKLIKIDSISRISEDTYLISFLGKLGIVSGKDIVRPSTFDLSDIK